MDSWAQAALYLVVVAFLLKFLSWCADSAALRGQRGNALGDTIQRGLRLLFFGVMVAPLVAAFPLALPAVVLYLFSYLDLSEINCGRPSAAFVKLRFWGWISSYLKLKIISEATEEELAGDKPFILGLHPHGILPFGGILNVVSPLNGFRNGVGRHLKLRGLAASFCFFIPGYRDLVLAAGICDAARFSAHKLLSEGHSIFVVPGGATEALYASPTEDVCYIKKRKGFVRLAMQHGASLVPVFSFNENNQYDQFDTKAPWVMSVKKKFQAVFGLSLPLIKNIIPRRCEITTVVGKPIAVEKDPTPSEEAVERVLQEYIAALVDLYERNSHFNIPPNKKITIV